MNFIEPSGGTANVAGLDATKHPLESKKHLAYIPEQVMLYRNLSGLENLEYFSGLAGQGHTRDELRAFYAKPIGRGNNFEACWRVLEGEASEGQYRHRQRRQSA